MFYYIILYYVIFCCNAVSNDTSLDERTAHAIILGTFDINTRHNINYIPYGIYFIILTICIPYSSL